MKRSQIKSICSACGCKSAFSRVGLDNGGSEWIKCVSCHSLSMHPFPTRDELQTFYRDYYDRPLLPLPPSASNRLASLITTLETYRTEASRIMDIGYGEGWFLLQAHRMGWNCSGTEFDTSVLQFGRDQGWTIFSPDDALDQAFGTYDVVSIMETLEHVTEPGDLIRTAHQLLHVGGALYLTTPNASSLNARILGHHWSVMVAPEHLTLWSRQALSTTLTRNGFQVISLTSTGFNPYDLLSRARGRSQGGDGRVALGYSIQEKLTKSRTRRLLLNGAQQILKGTNLGDTLKVVAVKLEVPPASSE